MSNRKNRSVKVDRLAERIRTEADVTAYATDVASTNRLLGQVNVYIPRQSQPIKLRVGVTDGRKERVKMFHPSGGAQVEWRNDFCLRAEALLDRLGIVHERNGRAVVAMMYPHQIVKVAKRLAA